MVKVSVPTSSLGSWNLTEGLGLAAAVETAGCGAELVASSCCPDPERGSSFSFLISNTWGGLRTGGVARARRGDGVPDPVMTELNNNRFHTLVITQQNLFELSCD